MSSKMSMRPGKGDSDDESSVYVYPAAWKSVYDYPVGTFLHLEQNRRQRHEDYAQKDGKAGIESSGNTLCQELYTSIIVFKEGKALIYQISPRKHNAGKWELPGGSLHQNDYILDGAASAFFDCTRVKIAKFTHVLSATTEASFDQQGSSRVQPAKPPAMPPAMPHGGGPQRTTLALHMVLMAVPETTSKMKVPDPSYGDSHQRWHWVSQEALNEYVDSSDKSKGRNFEFRSESLRASLNDAFDKLGPNRQSELGMQQLDRPR